MRVYRNHLVDNARWDRFQGRPGDVIITTPSKCGTTWMQNIVGLLLLDDDERQKPLTKLSPWLDAKTATDDEVFAVLEAQRRRRYLKTHVPFDGLPWNETWTYITVYRHPLDAALSWRDHIRNIDREHLWGVITRVMGEAPVTSAMKFPEDPREFLNFWIANEHEPDGSSLHGLMDFAHSLNQAWSRRHEPNVHLFHYDDLWRDLGGEITRLADILNLPLDADRHSAVTEAATLRSMRARAAKTAPYGDTALFKDPTAFFRQGGTRDWRALLTAEEIGNVERRLTELAGDAAAAWALHGNPALAT